MVFSIIIYLIVAILLAVVALSLKTQLPGLDPNIALVTGFSQLLQPGLLGLAIVMFFSALMSTADTFFYTAASSLTQDLLKKRQSVRGLRVIIIGVIIGAAGIAIVIESLIIGTYIFSAFFMVLAIPTLASWIRTSLSSLTLSLALLISLFSALGLIIAIPLEPAIAILAMGTAVLGLVVGGVVSWILRKKEV